MDTVSVLKATDNDRMGMGRTLMGRVDMAVGLTAMGSVRMDMATGDPHMLMASRDTAMAVVARDSRKKRTIGVGKTLFVYD